MSRPVDRNAPHWHPRRLDAVAFARAGAAVDGTVSVSDLPRLAADLNEAARSHAVRDVTWRARGEWRDGAAGQASAAWMHLEARAVLPLTCQRCLGPVDSVVVVDRWFRFVADEAAAEAEDDACEEDLLAIEPRPDLVEVIEDELLMSLPIVPMHEVCPEALPFVAGADAVGATPERPHPFAALEALKKRG